MNDVTGNQIAALLLPSAVTLVSAFDEADDVCVATIAWVMPISHEPSLIVVSIRPGGRTSNAMAHSGRFAVNVLPATPDGVRTAMVCGKKSGVEDRMAQAQLTYSNGAAINVPCIDQAVSWIECELVERKVYGDHELFIGETRAARTSGGLGEDGTVEPEAALAMGQRGCFGHFAQD